MAKTLLVTKSYPPVVGGSAYLLYEITKHFKQDELVVVHGVNDPPIESNQHLPFKRKQVLFLGSGMNTLRFNRYFPKWYISLIRLHVRKMIRSEIPDCIYIHFPNGAFSVAAYLEAKRFGIPYIFYQDILWEERERGAELELAKVHEAEVVKHATQCIAITEFAADHQTKKHKKEFLTIPHTLDISTVPAGINEVNNVKKRIHFAGGIYPQMNEDSVVRLIEACKSLPFEVEFEFCSPDVPNSLKNEKIDWKYLDKSKLLEAQRNCNLLFLPQAFASDTKSMIEHNFPTKTMEYLCSGRPILVHSPSNSYLSHLCREKGFGLLIDEPDTSKLSEALLKLLSDKSLQETYVNKAISLAKERDSIVWYNLLREIISAAKSK